MSDFIGRITVPSLAERGVLESAQGVVVASLTAAGDGDVEPVLSGGWSFGSLWFDSVPFGVTEFTTAIELPLTTLAGVTFGCQLYHTLVRNSTPPGAIAQLHDVRIELTYSNGVVICRPRTATIGAPGTQGKILYPGINAQLQCWHTSPLSDWTGPLTLSNFQPFSDTLASVDIFPLRTEFPHGRAQQRMKIVHQFGSANAKIEQRFYVGDGATRYTFHRARLNNSDRILLRNFWEARGGASMPFLYDVPNEDQSFTRKTVLFENVPLVFEELTDAVCSVGLTFVEVPNPDDTPVYSLGAVVSRFPNNTLTEALLDQAQDIIPLVKVRPVEGLNAPLWDSGTTYYAGQVVNLGSTGLTGRAYLALDLNTGHSPDALDSGPPHWRPFEFLFSDRRVIIEDLRSGADPTEYTYLPRLLRIGEANSGVLISQSTDGSTDDAQFSFGNADRVMVQVANDTQLLWSRVELSLYHVGSTVRLDLWAGYIVDWQSDAGPELTVKCSDILSALTLSSPVSTISRTCWRRLGKDGCPWDSATDTRDLTHFPSALTTQCDLGYNTPNGCLAHGPTVTAPSYGASYCSPQNVPLRVAVTAGSFLSGLFGGGGNTTVYWHPRTSLISDTTFGRSLTEVWHNDDGIPQYALPVMCKIAAGRDEDQMYEAVGIVGKGPLGAFTVLQMYDSNGDGIKDAFAGSTLDGYPNHGWQVYPTTGLLKPDVNGNPRTMAQAMYGLRQVLGADPAGTTDYFSLDRDSATAVGWFQQPSDGSWMEEVVGPADPITHLPTSAYNRVYAAGVAFCVIRRSKAASDPLTSPGDHQMIAAVSKGLDGLSWTAPGDRTTIPGCTNPFWVTINTFLYAIGMHGADASTQEHFFDLEAVIGPSGHPEFGAATIADTVVDKIFGTGTEIQFRFKGSIDDRKPTRDWLQAILNSGSGYYVWSGGKLKVGCRENASAVSAFTAGNMLFGSLRLTPVIPKFEKLTASFLDQDYQFQGNTVELTDQDHAARYNRSQNPLASTLALSGSSTKSEAARVLCARSREELGGVTQAEQDAARIATWKTTILALDTEAGMVASVTDDDVPGGLGHFRIERWSLNRDWSIDIQGRSVTPSMYDLTIGPKPADVVPSPIPTEKFFTRVLPWNPGFESPISGDSMFKAQGFGVQPLYSVATDGTAIAQLAIYGNPPIAVASTLIGTPQILSIVAHSSGGTIKAGIYQIALSAFDAATDGNRSRLSPPVAVLVPSGTTNRLTITVQWPPASFGGNVFAGIADDNPDHGLQYEDAFGTGASTDGTVGAFDLTHIDGIYFGAPDTHFDHLEFEVSEEIHGGSWANPVNVVGAATLQWLGQTFTVNQFADCDLSLLAFDDLSKRVMIADLHVVSNTADTFTIGANALGVSPPDLTTLFSPGDVFMMRMSPTDADATSFTDSRLANSMSGAGLTPHVESGIAYVFKGTGAGQRRVIADNTETKIIVAAPWDIIPDATSRIVILAPSLSDALVTKPLRMANYAGFSGNVGTVLSANKRWATFWIEAYSADANGVRSTTPAVREIFTRGAPETTITITADDSPYQWRWVDMNVWVDSSDGPVEIDLPPMASFGGRPVFIKKISLDSFTVTVKAFGAEKIDGASEIVLADQWESLHLKSNV